MEFDNLLTKVLQSNLDTRSKMRIGEVIGYIKGFHDMKIIEEKNIF